MSIEHIALIDFTLKPDTEKLKLPFLTSASVENPNLIEHLLTLTNHSKIFNTLISASSHISCEGAETVASILLKVAEVPDLLGKVKAIKRNIIPSNSSVKVKCKANTEFETDEKSVIFQPLTHPKAVTNLGFRASYKIIRKRRTWKTLHNVSAVIPI